MKVTVLNAFMYIINDRHELILKKTSNKFMVIVVKL